MLPQVRLRRHRPGDMGWVVQRHGELYWDEYGYDERFEALVAGIVAGFINAFDAKRERCWIAERDGRRLGAVFLVKKSAAQAQLRLLIVEPAARGIYEKAEFQLVRRQAHESFGKPLKGEYWELKL